MYICLYFISTTGGYIRGHTLYIISTDEASRHTKSFPNVVLHQNILNSERLVTIHF